MLLLIAFPVRKHFKPALERVMHTNNAQRDLATSRGGWLEVALSMFGMGERIPRIAFIFLFPWLEPFLARSFRNGLTYQEDASDVPQIEDHLLDKDLHNKRCR